MSLFKTQKQKEKQKAQKRALKQAIQIHNEYEKIGAPLPPSDFLAELSQKTRAIRVLHLEYESSSSEDEDEKKDDKLNRHNSLLRQELRLQMSQLEKGKTKEFQKEKRRLQRKENRKKRNSIWGSLGGLVAFRPRPEKEEQVEQPKTLESSHEKSRISLSVGRQNELRNVIPPGESSSSFSRKLQERSKSKPNMFDKSPLSAPPTPLGSPFPSPISSPTNRRIKPGTSSPVLVNRRKNKGGSNLLPQSTTRISKETSPASSPAISPISSHGSTVILNKPSPNRPPSPNKVEFILPPRSPTFKNQIIQDEVQGCNINDASPSKIIQDKTKENNHQIQGNQDEILIIGNSLELLLQYNISPELLEPPNRPPPPPPPPLPLLPLPPPQPSSSLLFTAPEKNRTESFGEPPSRMAPIPPFDLALHDSSLLDSLNSLEGEAELLTENLEVFSDEEGSRLGSHISPQGSTILSLDSTKISPITKNVNAPQPSPEKVEFSKSINPSNGRLELKHSKTSIAFHRTRTPKESVQTDFESVNNQPTEEQPSENQDLQVRKTDQEVTEPRKMRIPYYSDPTHFQPSDEFISLNGKNLEVLQELGRGATATVFKGAIDGKLVALKQILLTGVKNRRAMRRVLRDEVEMMKPYIHPNVIRYFGLFYSKETQELNIVMEFVDGGSITSLIQRYETEDGIPGLSETIAGHIMYQALEGLDFLHQNSIIHRDLKPDNMLVDKKGTVKIIDFGTSTKLEEQALNRRSSVGTPWYTAPEVINGDPYSFPADVWSLACTLLEIVTGEPPYADLSAVNALYKMSEETPSIPTHLSLECQSFLKICWNRQWNERPTTVELLDHTFITTNVIQEGENELYLLLKSHKR